MNKWITLAACLPLAAMAEGRFKLYEKTLSNCYEVQAFDAAKIRRVGKGPGSFDEFRYSLRFRNKLKTLVLTYNRWDEVVFEKEVDSQTSQSESFSVGEDDGGPKELERRVKFRIDELEFDKCEPVAPVAPVPAK